MPELSRFYGIVIKMYFAATEHNKPHIHAIYGEYMGSIDIYERKMIVGDLPQKALRMIYEWIDINEEELIDIWNTQKIRKISPLK